MNTILVVEDDLNIRKLMKEVLSQHGYEALLASDGEVALELMDRHHVDLIVMDIMMPNMDGYELTRILRDSGSQVPILMATAKEEFIDKKRGFTYGADDYMVKPLNEEELVLRIGALLRRSKIANDSVLAIGATSLYYDELAVVENNQDRQVLPKKEFLLLFKFLSYPNKIFTRRQLIDEIWSMESETDERTVDVHINRLRDRFRESADFELVTVRGLGYKAVLK